MTSPDRPIELTIILSALDQPEELASLLPKIHSTLADLSIGHEIIVLVHAAGERTRREIEDHHTTLVSPPGSGYGEAIRSGLRQAAGEYLLFMDTGQDHPLELFKALWQAREAAEVIIASRYAPEGQADMPPVRKVFSKMLNLVFSRGLDLHIRDMSSGYRLYKAQAVQSLEIESKDYDILQEILVRSLMEGYRIKEVPYAYHSRDTQLGRVFRFGLAYLRTFNRLWRLRNSISSADYDARAYDALMPPQRYWQRQRYQHITRMTAGKGICLDVGCGSSRIIGSLPPGSVALDISMRKLRFDRRYCLPMVQGSIVNLPIGSRAFPCVICSQVIEHVRRENVPSELDRVLQPGGFLILGTPDYAKWQWVLIEWLYGLLLPQAYADEHITHYTRSELIDEFVGRRGYQLEMVRYILQGEMILGLRKPTLPD
jgi:dolichol-phosphate mannosyltransferase